MRNELIEEILNQRLNSKQRSKGLTVEEILFQIEHYKSLNTKYEEELADDKKTLERCYAIDRFIY